MVTVDDVRAVVRDLPRSYEVRVGGRVKFRVGRIVYISFSRDETVMGFAFPKEELARLSELDPGEMRELVIDAWRMVVPKRVAAAHVEL